MTGIVELLQIGATAAASGVAALCAVRYELGFLKAQGIAQAAAIVKVEQSAVEAHRRIDTVIRLG